MNMTFNKWLRLQKDRDDPIGDVARDFIDDTKNRARRKFDEDYLFSQHACKEAINAFRLAKKEYLKYGNSETTD